MNDTLDILQNHRTYRDYEPDTVLPDTHIQALLNSARQAPSWMNGQHYSIIRITDPNIRRTIGKLQPKNPQIITAAEFWVFVADLYRVHLACQAYGGNGEHLAGTESLITAVTDTALAAENALIAAESLGYAGCFIGSIRADAAALIELLALPEYCYPLFGLCIGKPSTPMRVKPRLPEQAVVFENRYNPALEQPLAEYEQTMLDFAEARETLPWREKFARYYSRTPSAAGDELFREQKILK